LASREDSRGNTNLEAASFDLDNDRAIELTLVETIFDGAVPRFNLSGEFSFNPSGVDCKVLCLRCNERRVFQNNPVEGNHCGEARDLEFFERATCLLDRVFSGGTGDDELGKKGVKGTGDDITGSDS
jgi:hypothetical protein